MHEQHIVKNLHGRRDRRVENVVSISRGMIPRKTSEEISHGSIFWPCLCPLPKGPVPFSQWLLRRRVVQGGRWATTTAKKESYLLKWERGLGFHRRILVLWSPSRILCWHLHSRNLSLQISELFVFHPARSVSFPSGSQLYCLKAYLSVGFITVPIEFLSVGNKPSEFNEMPDPFTWNPFDDLIVQQSHRMISLQLSSSGWLGLKEVDD